MTTINMTRGIEFYMGWRWLYGDSPKDLTDYNINIQIRPFKTSSTIIASFTRFSPYVTVDDLDGSVGINIPPSVTLAYDFKTAYIDCWITNTTDTDGERSPSYKIILDWGVTR